MGSRYRPSRHYFLMRVSEFTNFQDPDVFSPHMDLKFLRKVYAELQSAIERDPNFAIQQRPDPEQIPSTPYVVATRPERAARDLAKRVLVAENTKYEVRIEQNQSGFFVLRYRKAWKQWNDSWSPPVRMRHDLVRFSDDEPYSERVREYTGVEIPSFAQEKVFVQFFRLEPSFQFYEYAVVVIRTEDRQLRLPGWKGESVPFEHKLVVKSMFRPFLIKQGRNVFVQNANSVRDAFKKASSKLSNNHVRITISDVFDRHRYTNDEGVVQYKLRKAPVIGEFRRRADSKRKRTHCIEKTFLFEKGELRHVLHTTFMDDDVIERELSRKLKHAVKKFLRMARSSRVDARDKESSTFSMLKNRWFLVACASLSTDPSVNLLLKRAFDALHARNPAVIQTEQMEYADLQHDNLFETLYGLLEDFDVETDDVPYSEYTVEIDKDELVETLEERNLPVPPSDGCDGVSTVQTQRGVAMKVTEGHDPFPTDLLSGSVRGSFGEFLQHQTNYTRDFILDTYVKHIRDDLKRTVKRTNDEFIQYLESISVHAEEDDGGLHFGQRRSMNWFQRIVRALFGN